jgi:hypothetical protein
LLELLYSPIVSAIGNVVDFMVGTSQFVGIALGFAASLVEACPRCLPAIQTSLPSALGVDTFSNI